MFTITTDTGLHARAEHPDQLPALLRAELLAHAPTEPICWQVFAGNDVVRIGGFACRDTGQDLYAAAESYVSNLHLHDLSGPGQDDELAPASAQHQDSVDVGVTS